MEVPPASDLRKGEKEMINVYIILQISKLKPCLLSYCDSFFYINIDVVGDYRAVQGAEGSHRECKVCTHTREPVSAF